MLQYVIICGSDGKEYRSTSAMVAAQKLINLKMENKKPIAYIRGIGDIGKSIPLLREIITYRGFKRSINWRSLSKILTAARKEAYMNNWR